MPKCAKDYKDQAKRISYFNRNRKKNYNKTSFKYEKRRWTEAEDQAVLAHEITDFELSSEICRSVQAIQLRRCRLNGKVNNAQQ